MLKIQLWVIISKILINYQLLIACTMTLGIDFTSEQAPQLIVKDLMIIN